MTTYSQWAIRHPQAAAELAAMLGTVHVPTGDPAVGSEAAAQQQARLSIAKQGAASWRNNVGATPATVQATCPRCQLRHTIKQVPIRYGLANDSQKLNGRVKSSDLILAIPRVITPAMVGTTVAQFGAVECKRPGWRYTGTPAEVAQQAYLQIVQQLGGFAAFSTGEVKL